MKSLLTFWKFSDFIIFSTSSIISFFSFVNGLFLFIYVFSFYIISNYIFYNHLTKKYIKKETTFIFGIHTNQFLKVEFYFLTLLLSISFLILYIYPDVFLSTKLVWVYFSITINKYLELFIPITNWSIIIDKNIIYTRNGVTFELSKNMIVKKIATDKIEIALDDWTQEIYLDDEEVKKLEEVIKAI